jgi:hypothetical protein
MKKENEFNLNWNTLFKADNKLFGASQKSIRWYLPENILRKILILTEIGKPYTLINQQNKNVQQTNILDNNNNQSENLTLPMDLRKIIMYLVVELSVFKRLTQDTKNYTFDDLIFNPDLLKGNFILCVI